MSEVEPAEYRAIVGLECHVQLATRTKLFCSCPVRATAPPNTLLCTVCTGQPGSLPTVNSRAVALAIKAGVALSCGVNPQSSWDRKTYTSPDLPKGYQITQQRRPLCSGGTLRVRVGDEIQNFSIHAIQLEEDSGRTVDGAKVDLNRAGAPLIEVVGEPDLENGHQAERWLRMLHRCLVEVGVTEGELQNGQLRCDVNVSVNGGERVELKNLNSFRHVRKAVEHEIARQQAVLQAGGTVARETRRWTGQDSETLRAKESLEDYRFLPEGNLPALVVTTEQVREAFLGLPGPIDKHLLNLDMQLIQRWRMEHDLDAESIQQLMGEQELRAVFEEAASEGGKGRHVASLVLGELKQTLASLDRPLEKTALTPAHFRDLSILLDQGTITRATARKLVDWVALRGGHMPGLVEILGWKAIRDPEILRAAVDKALADHPDERSRAAERPGLADFFVGKALAGFDGRADPEQVRAMVQEALDL